MRTKKLITILLQIICLMLFLSTHYIDTIFDLSKRSGIPIMLLGVNIGGFIIDIILWIGIIIQFIIIVLLLISKKENT